MRMMLLGALSENQEGRGSTQDCTRLQGMLSVPWLLDQMGICEAQLCLEASSLLQMSIHSQVLQ